MVEARYLIGDVFDRMAELEDGSVDLVLTSPPFLALRSYLPADHPDKAKEIGSEATPADFLDTLLALTAEWRRLLAPHGSIAVELGDTYAGSGGGGGDYLAGGMREGQPGFTGSASKGRDEQAQRDANAAHWRSKNAQREAWPLDKSLCGIPTLFAWSLAYGVNLLTGEPSPAGQWRVRNVVAWCRPNPPVGALGDKFRPATSYMTIATVARDRYFDLDAVRVPSEDTRPRNTNGPKALAADESETPSHYATRTTNPAGAPPLDYWEIPTAPYKGSHYATFPPALCKRPIEAMVPQRVCLTCGKPSERITSEPTYERTDTDRVPARLAMTDGERVAEGVNQHVQENGANTSVVRQVETLGWTDCGHDSWRLGVVLDPFAGSGTTLAVATGLGRDAIGIDLDERNAELARERVGMFLEIHYHTEGAA